MLAMKNAEIESARVALKEKFEKLEDKRSILRATEIKDLYGKIKDIPNEEKKDFGAAVNELKQEVQGWLERSRR